MELISKKTKYEAIFNQQEIKVMSEALVLLKKTIETQESGYLGVKTGVIEDLIQNINYCLKMEM